ncbi:coiled-coil domain-containing protein 175 [Salvelinus fontinalis]|uniref:coiled-coil domain-containing protein 175 n=1 Tax=Salvelinus fontinalis TaxID=8038 RepID=UPI002484FD73|nr:coiled-coil domain-containing protein 175 [Salvelinus fontinalis]
MASCLVPDFPAVLVALEHLGELDKQLRNEGVPFSPEASHHLKEIAAAITELETSRRVAHEQLEVETIETSKLRHQCQTIHDDVQNEISAGVAAARNINAGQITQLQDELNSIVLEIELMEKKQEVLEKQNAILYPERELVKGDHENVINQLNYQLSEKANKQILLNETMNEIKEGKAKITDVETAKVELEEDMIQERKTFDETNENLQRECEEVINNIQNQKKNNEKKRRELDIFLPELLDKEDKVTEQKKQILQLEQSIAKLTASEIQYKEQLADEINTFEELVLQKEFHVKELAEVRIVFELKVQALQEKIVEVDGEMEEGQIVNAIRLESIAKMSDRFKAQRKEEDDVMAEHLNVSRRLEKSRLRLEERVASIAKHKIEIREMDEEIKQLHETNIVNADLFERNVDELHGQLNKEKKNIAIFEVEKEELCQSLENLKKDQVQHVKQVNSNIGLTRRRYEELLEEEKKLRDHVFMGASIELLSNKIVKAEEGNEQITISYNAEIQQFITEAESVTQRRLEKEEDLKGKESILEEAEAQFDIDQSRHQKLKNHTSELKSKNNHLELFIQDMKESTSTLLKPKEDMKRSLEGLREKHMELLTSHAADIIATEKSIYDKGMMLEQVNMENSRLHVCIEQMKEDIWNTRKDQERHTKEIGWLKEEVHSLFESLLDAWAEDTVVTEESSERDHKILEAIYRLMTKIHDRKFQLGDINSRLEEELKGMSSLLASTKSNIALKEQGN